MRILAWSPVYWLDGVVGPAFLNPITGLKPWMDRMTVLLSPVDIFVASGSWSDPALCPIPVPVINSGVEWCGSYDYGRRHYWKCASSAALAYAINRKDWDLLACVDCSVLFGDINLDTILREFIRLPALIMAPGWWGYPGGPFILKREGAVRLAHYRKTPNMLDDDEPVPGGEYKYCEMETLKIVHGRWYNPWPNNPCVLHQGQPEAINWPVIADIKDEEFKRLYFETQCPKTKPVLT